jgi:hypothetical protein
MFERVDSLRSVAVPLFLVVFAGVACRQSRTVRIAWDAPVAAPTGYKILIDDEVVMEILPPPLDPSCSCLAVSVPVQRGEHTITVIAYNQFGQSAPSTITFVK